MRVLRDNSDVERCVMVIQMLDRSEL
jgi:hypothetical protein